MWFIVTNSRISPCGATFELQSPALGHVQLKHLHQQAIQSYYAWKGKIICILTPAEVEVLFETAEDNYYYPVIYTAVSTGLRQAELLGLRWRDIDLDYLSIIAKRAGLSGVRFHDLRHTFASLMLLRGAKPKVISEALGHNSVTFTMDVYSHIIGGMQEDARALLGKVLAEGVDKNFVAKLSPTFRDLALMPR